MAPGASSRPHILSLWKKRRKYAIGPSTLPLLPISCPDKSRAAVYRLPKGMIFLPPATTTRLSDSLPFTLLPDARNPHALPLISAPLATKSPTSPPQAIVPPELPCDKTLLRLPAQLPTSVATSLATPTPEMLFRCYVGPMSSLRPTSPISAQGIWSPLPPQYIPISHLLLN